MEVKVSSKYQIVIPKTVRRQLGIKPGQKVEVGEVKDNQVTISKPLTSQEYVQRYAGTLTNTDWQNAKMDATVWLRQERNKDR